MKMETTEVFETSTLSIHTPGNYPKEEITQKSDTVSEALCSSSSKTRKITNFKM
jgi:hypothetical protein